ncbi:MAG: FG-GAP-like repeat-containing protein [bacterium]
MHNIILFVLLVIKTQTDWGSGPGTLGPVNNWKHAFSQQNNITCNIHGQLSPVATSTNPTAWIKHTIDQQNTYIDGSNALTCGDFDNDNDNDIVGVRKDSLVFYENKTDTFVKKSLFPLSVGWGASVNDINNDGRLDVVVSQQNIGISWFENLGGFNFSQHTISTGASVGGLSCETGDINNDGTIDIVTTGFPHSTGSIGIWANNGSGGFTNAQTISKSSWRVKLDDLDNDGDLDLISANYPEGTWIYLNNGTAHFDSVAFINSNGVDGVWSRDFDNDGDVDIITGEFGNSGQNFIHWWENDGTGINYTSHIVYSGSSWRYGDGCFTEDIDMDGKTDVVSGFTQLAFFKQNNINNFTENYICGVFSDTHWMIPLSKGKCFPCVDILFSCTGYFLWYENNMINQFADSSYLESSILNSTCDANWLKFGYTVCSPFDSSLMFQFRSGNTVAEITGNNWSAPLCVSSGTEKDSVSLAPYITSRDSLFQYRVNLFGRNKDAGVLYEVWTEFECGGAIEEKNTPLKVDPGKALKIINDKICYSLTRESDVSLKIYGIDGRLVKSFVLRKSSPGEHSMNVPRLNKGIYFVLLTTEGKTTTAKFVIAGNK